jgi:hypothetical protein
MPTFIKCTCEAIPKPVKRNEQSQGSWIIAS